MTTEIKISANITSSYGTHSTPRRSRTVAELKSPSLSTISGQSGSTTSKSKSGDDPKDIGDSFEIIKRGIIWIINKPCDSNSLYYEIIVSDYINIENIAERETLRMLDEGNTSVVEYKLYRLLLDVSDYRHFKLPEAFTENSDFEELLKTLNEVKPEHLLTMSNELYYIAMCTSNLKIAMFRKVLKFYEDYVEHLHSKGKVNIHFKCFLQFLSTMSESRYHVLKHTSTVIAAKILTKLIQITKIKTDFNNLKKYNTILHRIYDGNCSIQCAKLKTMRMQLLKESLVWMTSSKDYWNMCLKHIMNAIKDGDDLVTIVGLQLLKELLSEFHCVSKLPHLMKKVTSHLRDTSYLIRKLSVEICDITIQRYNYKFLSNVRETFAYLIYDNDASVGRAAFVVYREILSENNADDTSIFMQIIDMIKAKLELLPCFVESAINLLPILDNVENVFDNYLNLYKKEDDREVVIMLILEYAAQRTSGKSRYVRDHPFTRNPDREDNLKISRVILNKSKLVLEKTTMNVLNVLRCFLLTNKELFVSEEYEDVFKTLQINFSLSKDPQVLDAIATIIFVDFKDSNGDFLREYLELFDSTVETYKSVDTMSGELHDNMKIYYKKLALIMERVDVIDHIQIVVLFDLIKLIASQTEYNDSIFLCTSWHLIWTCKRLIAEEIVNLEELQTLYVNVGEFINTSMTIIDTNQYNQLKICNYVLTLITNLIDVTDTNGKLKVSDKLFNDLQESSLYTSMTGLFTSNRRYTPIEFRKITLGMYIGLIEVGRINQKYLVIYKYFKDFRMEYDQFQFYWDRIVKRDGDIVILQLLLNDIYTDCKEDTNVMAIAIKEQITFYKTLLTKDACYELLKSLIETRQVYDFLKYLTPIANRTSAEQGHELEELVKKEGHSLLHPKM